MHVLAAILLIGVAFVLALVGANLGVDVLFVLALLSGASGVFFLARASARWGPRKKTRSSRSVSRSSKASLASYGIRLTVIEPRSTDLSRNGIFSRNSTPALLPKLRPRGQGTEAYAWFPGRT